jgi:hypothetical protein
MKAPSQASIDSMIKVGSEMFRTPKQIDRQVRECYAMASTMLKHRAGALKNPSSWPAQWICNEANAYDQQRYFCGKAWAIYCEKEGLSLEHSSTDIVGFDVFENRAKNSI